MSWYVFLDLDHDQKIQPKHILKSFPAVSHFSKRADLAASRK